jgi:hypothetical protein
MTPDTFYYDFEQQTNDWLLDSGVWSRASLGNEHALRGSGHGFASLISHKGPISSLRFRFCLSNLKSSLHANVLETKPQPHKLHTRYLVGFSANGVNVARQQGAVFTDLGLGFVPIEPNVSYEALILVGDGSIDVFLDNEGVVGVDDSEPPPPGSVSFECFGAEKGIDEEARIPPPPRGYSSFASQEKPVVYVDDVTVGIGPKAVPHPRAPRPPLNLPHGPNIGPFVQRHIGDIDLSDNEVLTLAQGRYSVIKGNINLSGYARLRIESGAVLVFDRADSPLIHHAIKLRNDSSLEINGGIIVSNGGLVYVDATDHSSVTIKDSKSWIHFINASGYATINIQNSRLVTSIGGSLQIGDRVSADVRSSKLGAIALSVPKDGLLRASGLCTGFYKHFDLLENLEAVGGIQYTLRMTDVTLVDDTLGVGPYERGWIVFADARATVDITNSILRKLVLTFPTSAASLSFKDLRLNEPMNWKLRRVSLHNVTVTGQWGFFIHGLRRAQGTRQVTFEDCHGLWLFLFDNIHVLLRRTTMNEFDPRHYTGTLEFEDSSWVMAGEIIEGNDFRVEGDVTMDQGVRRSLSWDGSVVTRQYLVRVLDPPDQPICGTEISLRRPGNVEVITATTNSSGEAMVELRFTDEDYNQPWRMTTTTSSLSMDVDFFTNTPIVRL